MKKNIFIVIVSLLMIPTGVISIKNAQANSTVLENRVLLAQNTPSNPTGVTAPGQGSATPTKTSASCKNASCIRDALTLLQYAIYLIENYLVSLMFAAAIMFFFWNVAMFIWQPGDAGKRSENLKNIAWSVGGLFVMFAIYGIIAMISNSLNIGVGGTMEIPHFKIGDK